MHIISRPSHRRRWLRWLERVEYRALNKCHVLPYSLRWLKQCWRRKLPLRLRMSIWSYHCGFLIFYLVTTAFYVHGIASCLSNHSLFSDEDYPAAVNDNYIEYEIEFFYTKTCINLLNCIVFFIYMLNAGCYISHFDRIPMYQHRIVITNVQFAGLTNGLHHHLTSTKFAACSNVFNFLLPLNSHYFLFIPIHIFTEITIYSYFNSHLVFIRHDYFNNVVCYGNY